jgi:hypothetical protein
MNKQEFREFDRILREQRSRVTHSKVEARKLLKKLGILHLLVAKGTNKSSSATSR